jgi:tetratricopeptide (TPR) repeat protein
LRRRLGHHAGAEEDLRRAAELDGKNPWVRFRLATLYQETARPAQALAQADQLLERLAPANSDPAKEAPATGLWFETQLLRSQALLALGREAEAAAVVRTVEAERARAALVRSGQ